MPRLRLGKRVNNKIDTPPGLKSSGTRDEILLRRFSNCEWKKEEKIQQTTHIYITDIPSLPVFKLDNPLLGLFSHKPRLVNRN